MSSYALDTELNNLFGPQWSTQGISSNWTRRTGGTPATPVNTTPTGVTDYSAVAGGKPLVPALAGSQQQAITGNLGNLANLQNLAGQLNLFNAQQAKNQLATNLPGYTNNLAQAATNTGSLLKGQLPADVMQNLQQWGAERGVGMGSIGSPNANAAYMKALGLNSLGVQGQGLQNLQALTAMTPTGGLFNYGPMMFGTGEQQSANYAANVNASAPVPANALQAQMQMAQLGQSHGYNASAPRQQATMGNNQSYSPSTNLASKYSYTGVPATGESTSGSNGTSAPGWGEAWNSWGGYNSMGNVPPPNFVPGEESVMNDAINASIDSYLNGDWLYGE